MRHYLITCSVHCEACGQKACVFSLKYYRLCSHVTCPPCPFISDEAWDRARNILRRTKGVALPTGRRVPTFDFFSTIPHVVSLTNSIWCIHRLIQGYITHTAFIGNIFNRSCSRIYNTWTVSRVYKYTHTGCLSCLRVIAGAGPSTAGEVLRRPFALTYWHPCQDLYVQRGMLAEARTAEQSTDIPIKRSHFSKQHWNWTFIKRSGLILVRYVCLRINKALN